jgi:hypothetical protein
MKGLKRKAENVMGSRRQKEVLIYWFSNGNSELDRIVHHSALRATGQIDVGIICVNVSASSATINAILTFGRLKAASPQFGVDSNGG